MNGAEKALQTLDLQSVSLNIAAKILYFDK